MGSHLVSLGRSVVVGALGVSLVLAPGQARAGDPREDSRAAFLQGVSEAHREHFTAARDAFLEAYRLFQHPSILLNLGVARMHTGEYVAAEENLSRFLVDDGGASAEDLANARATLVVVRKHLGTVRLRVSPEAAHPRATLDGVPLTLAGSDFTDVRAVVGPAELRVEADGYAPIVQPLVVAHDDNAPVDVQLRAASEASAGPGTHRPLPRNALVGWGLLGGATALAAVGAVAGFEAIGLASDYNTRGSAQFQTASTRSEGVAWRTTADVLFVTALVAGALGTYVLVKAPLRTTPRASSWLTPDASPLSFRF